MHGGMPWKSFQALCHIDQMVYILLLVISFFQLRIHFQCFINGNIQLLGNHLCNGIHLGIRHVQYTSHIPDHTTGSQCTKGNDLHYTVLTVFANHVIDHFLPALKTEVHINIRHGYSFRIQETLKKQIVTDRIQLGDPQGISNQASSCRTSARSYHDLMIPCIFNKVPHDQEIIHVSHIFDCGKLIIQTAFQLFCHRIVSFFQAFPAQLIQIFPGGISIRHIISGQLCVAELNIHVAPLCDLVCIFQSLRRIGKQCCHFFF